MKTSLSHSTRILLTFFITLGVGSLIFTAKSSCDKDMARLQKTYSNFIRLQAHFIHTLEAPALNQHVVEKGTLFLEKGGKMRWQYSDPPGKLAISDGKSTFLYLPDERQVFVRPMDTGPDSPLVIRLLSGKVDLKGEFDCTSKSVLGNDTTLHLVLVRPEAAVRNLQVTFNNRSGFLLRVSYEDAVNNHIVLELEDTKVPSKLDGDLFTFTPPHGVKVIRG